MRRSRPTWNRQLRQVVVAAFAAVAAIAAAAPADAEPRWRGDMETGDLSQWSYRLNERGLSVVTSPVADGGRAARVEIRPDDLWPNGLNRVELQHKPNSASAGESTEAYYAWSVYVPVALSDTRHQIGYWESDRSYRQIMAFEARGTALTFVTRFPDDSVRWTASARLTPKRWHRIVMHVKWSKDPALGLVEAWFDGAKVVSDVHVRTIWDNTAFLQIGMLRDVAGPTEEMFLDAAAEGETLADVAKPGKPAKPTKSMKPAKAGAGALPSPARSATQTELLR